MDYLPIATKSDTGEKRGCQWVNPSHTSANVTLARENTARLYVELVGVNPSQIGRFERSTPEELRTRAILVNISHATRTAGNNSQITVKRLGLAWIIHLARPDCDRRPVDSLSWHENSDVSPQSEKNTGLRPRRTNRWAGMDVRTSNN